jgi:hypothetical protein
MNVMPRDVVFLLHFSSYFGFLHANSYSASPSHSPSCLKSVTPQAIASLCSCISKTPELIRIPCAGRAVTL